MKFKKVAGLIATVTMLSISLITASANHESTSTINPKTVKTKNVNSIDEQIEPFADNLVISSQGAYDSTGSYQKVWGQPKGWGYARFNVTNKSTQNITIRIIKESSGKVVETVPDVRPGASPTRTLSNLASGDYKIEISTARGGAFSGDISVRISDFPLKNKISKKV